MGGTITATGTIMGWEGTQLTPAQSAGLAQLLGKTFQIVTALGNDPSAYTPADGEWYAVGSVAVGAWAGYEGYLARWGAQANAWTFYLAEGVIVYPQNVGNAWYYSSGTDWLELASNQVFPLSAGNTGSSQTFARGDHEHPATPAVSGNLLGSASLPWNVAHGARIPAGAVLYNGGTNTIGLASANDAHDIIVAMATGGDCILNLPAATEKRTLTIHLIIAGAFVVRLQPAGTDTINNGAAGAPVDYDVAYNGTHKHATCFSPGTPGAWISS